MGTQRERFPRSARLKDNAEFMRVYTTGARYRRGDLELYLLKTGTSEVRAGFSIRKRYIKLASRRNRIRRILREIYRKQQQKLKIGHCLVFVVKRDPGQNVSFDSLEKKVLDLIRQAHLST